ncbi:uncharacterized protein PG986_004613 [Apiospora aurea]|uniref:Phosphoinositide phospholipase C n=1 Tax=Apiospora aurea TaxID=335848 RepID=A0ABR1QN37_9PEZI
MYDTTHDNLLLSESLLTHLQQVFAKYSESSHRWDEHQAAAFFQHIQAEGAEHVPLGDGLDYGVFLQYMTSPAANALGPPPPEQDLSWPLGSYFCSSSHNTYLTGDQLASDASTTAYKDVLLRGCRCVEIDVWDGTEHFHDPDNPDASGLDGQGTRKLGFRARTALKLGTWVLDNCMTTEKAKEEAKEHKARFARLLGVEPRVLHGHTLTKEVPFREVCRAVKEHGFVTSDLPIVVSLEVHCTPPQQETMVEIMREEWAGLLLDEPDEPPQGLPSPAAMRNKILVKVKYVPPEGDLTPVTTTESDMSSLYEDGEPTKKEKPVKVTRELSDMGIYTRAVKYKSMAQQEAEMTGHIFSVSEPKLPGAFDKEASLFFAHNKRHLMRTYPAGTRVDSSNMDPSGHWRRGVQFAALNWQTLDEGMMLNEAMFDGSKGYVLKPDGYRGDAARVRRHRPGGPGSALGGGAELRPYVEVKLFADPHPLQLAKREPLAGRTEPAEGVDPDFRGQAVLFGDVAGVTPELSFLLFRVLNSEVGRDPLLGWACIRLDRLRTGYRIVRLFDPDNKRNAAALLVKIDMAVSNTGA